MNIAASINRFIGLFIETSKQFGRWRIWLVLLGLFFLNWLTLYAHLKFYSPLLYGPMHLWTSLFDDVQATGFTHYPDHYLLLPHFFGWAKFWLGLLAEGAVLGAVALMFYDGYQRSSADRRFSARAVLSSWIHLVAAWLIINGLIMVANLWLPEILQSWLAFSPRRIKAFRFGLLPLVYIVILAVFFYTIPRVAAFRENIITALKRSLWLFLRNPITTFCLSFIVLVVPAYVAVLSGQSADIVTKFKPELVYWLLLGGLLVDVLVSFFWMGTAVRLLVDEER
ncbi:MAG TPA: hypothetical protein VN285_01320 [Candidatus Deferrimicrobium sp.]|nr:hypothetical protein [Candidatus Deferrimicrobium sp.]